MSYHEEQESLENLKAWWAKWGNSTTWIVLAVLVVAAGWNGWNFWQRRQAAEAAVLYDQVQQAVASSDKAMVTRVGNGHGRQVRRHRLCADDGAGRRQIAVHRRGQCRGENPTAMGRRSRERR